MMIANLVQQKTTSTGDGSLTLTALNGRQSFYSAFGTGGTDMFFYFVMHADADEWEVGTGHLSDAITLVRDTVIASSNANAAVSFSAGDKYIVNDIPAEHQTIGPITSAHIGNFAEAAQDAIGAMANSTLAYDDATPSLGVVDNTSTQKVMVAQTGVTAGTRHKINFIEGSNVTIAADDNAGADRIDVTISASAATIMTDGQSVIGDGTSTPLSSHTRYDQSQSSVYAVQDSDNDAVFDDSSGDIELDLSGITTFPFSATLVNRKGNTTRIKCDGATIYVAAASYTPQHFESARTGSSCKIRIHEANKYFLEPDGYWAEVY